MKLDSCAITFGLLVVSLSIVIAFAIYYTKSAAPIWGFLIIGFYSCKPAKCLKNETPTYWTMDAETHESFEYVKVKDLK